MSRAGAVLETSCSSGRETLLQWDVIADQTLGLYEDLGHERTKQDAKQPDTEIVRAS